MDLTINREKTRIIPLCEPGMSRDFLGYSCRYETVNRQVRGWANYFDHGRSRPAFHVMNRFLQQRMVRHLKRRSQRPYRPPNRCGRVCISVQAAWLGAAMTAGLPGDSSDVKAAGKRRAGKPHAAFDE